jgi:hypothetical protein
MDVGIPESTAIGLFVIPFAIVIAVFIGAFLIGSIPITSTSAKKARATSER